MSKVLNAIAALLLSLSVSADGIDGMCEMSTCHAQEEAENENDADMAMHMQTRVMRHDTPTPAGDVPVASEPKVKPPPGTDDLDRVQAVTAAESILREGLREAVSDLRGEMQESLEKLKEREQKAERGQEAFGPLLEFRGLGSAPPMMVETMKSHHALGGEFLQMSALAASSASINVIVVVLAVIFFFFLVRKLLYIWGWREGKSKVEAFLEAENNASAKLQHLLNALGFDPTTDDGTPIVQETRNSKTEESACDSEEEPEAECSVETTVKAWFNKLAADNVCDKAHAPVIVAEAHSTAVAAEVQSESELDSLP